MPKDRIGTVFHETLTLNIPAIASVLRVSYEHDAKVTAETLRSETNLGANYIKAMPLYARGCGLLELGSFALTPFGQCVMEKDPNLTRLETLWIMHYYLSASQGPGPAFWNNLITKVVRIGQPLSGSVVATAISNYLQDSIQQTLSARAVANTATAFLGTYAKSDALGRLGIISPVEEAKGSYQTMQPDTPSLSAVACALVDYWEDFSNGSSELLLKDLGRQDGFAGLFFIGPGMLGALLSELQSKSIVSIKRDAPPFVVTRLWADPGELWGRLYA